MNPEEIISIAANVLNNKKARDISVIKVDSLTALTDYFLIASATSSTHVRSLADEVEEKLSECAVKPHHIEGKTTGWIVLDYASVIIHIFTPADRAFYNLDKMWSDGEEIDMSKILTESEGD